MNLTGDLKDLIGEKLDYAIVSKRRETVEITDSEFDIVVKRKWVDKISIDFFTLTWAIKRGKGIIFTWLWENKRELFHENSLNLAAKYGRLEMAKFLSENGFKPGFKGVNWACEGGYLEVVKFLYTIAPEKFEFNGLCEATRNGHHHIVKWFHQELPHLFTPTIMNVAAENGHLELIRWLHENRPEGCTTSAINSAALSGHLHVIEWLLKNRTEGYTDWAIRFAVMSGKMSILKLLAEKKDYPEAIEMAQNRGRTDMVEFLRKLKN